MAKKTRTRSIRRRRIVPLPPIYPPALAEAVEDLTYLHNNLTPDGFWTLKTGLMAAVRQTLRLKDRGVR